MHTVGTLRSKTWQSLKNLTYIDEKLVLLTKMCTNLSVDGRIGEMG